jgi:poly [ADP-ribose] polymerase 2/3/4
MGKPLELQEVWSVDRDGEDERTKENDYITNRKLLWHGTNVAVVAAILKSGLRIMPHSGGRVGRGIYFASENAKSANYGMCAAGFLTIAIHSAFFAALPTQTRAFLVAMCHAVGTTPESGGYTGIMFLVEVMLGKEHHITRDDSSLTKAPAGYDCVIAKVLA